MKETRITFPSGELTLEGLLAKPDKPQAGHAGVMCHPHPLYGGSMYNNVVEAVLQAMWRFGWATLRFNFRGVGNSTGEHSGGPGEAGDAAAAVNYVIAELGADPRQLVLAGYSFGAMAAMMAAPNINDLGALMLIALPTRMAAADTLRNFMGSIMLAAGDTDSYCPAPQLQSIASELGEQAQVRIINGADHFFGGYEEELMDAIQSMLRDAAKE
jgi:alpha/beta superfamily hydrolase